ncbi:MAG: hypothetical protein KAT65_29110, partial [Methanophagales archaeon]|nr:hypothetical protein [Methanophagales archaeon]
LALVFTITLVVSQMTRKYTAMDKIIFRPETIFLMIIFGIGVITPLLVLKIGFWGCGVILSIAIVSFCVFSLIPFLKGVNGVLKYDIGIGNLNEAILEAIELGYEPRAINKIGELNEISESAVREYREDVILYISRVQSRIAIKSAEKKLWDLTLLVIYVLKNIGVNSVEKELYNSTRGIVDGLRSIAGSTLADVKDAVTVEVLRGLSDIGVKAAEKKYMGEIISDVANNLTDFGRRWSKNEALIGLGCLGAAATKYMSRFIVDIVIRDITELEETISEDWLPLAERRCIEQYPDLKEAFEKFKRRYNKG